MGTLDLLLLNRTPRSVGTTVISVTGSQSSIRTRGWGDISVQAPASGVRARGGCGADRSPSTAAGVSGRAADRPGLASRDQRAGGRSSAQRPPRGGAPEACRHAARKQKLSEAVARDKWSLTVAGHPIAVAVQPVRIDAYAAKAPCRQVRAVEVGCERG